MVKYQLDFDALQRVKGENDILALVFKLADADVISQPEPDEGKVIDRELAAPHIDVLDIPVMSHDLDDAVVVREVVAADIEDLKILMVHK